MPERKEYNFVYSAQNLMGDTNWLLTACVWIVVDNYKFMASESWTCLSSRVSSRVMPGHPLFSRGLPQVM